MNIKPVKNNILIELHEIPQTAVRMINDKDTNIERATVLDVGDEVAQVVPGNVIVFKNYEMDTIELEGKKYHFITEDAIKAICTSTTSK
jgi:co-chaperonin GroES (HSP10)